VRLSWRGHVSAMTVILTSTFTLTFSRSTMTTAIAAIQ
jgi:hypothetical protein